MSELRKRLSRLERVVKASAGSGRGCHRCNASPLILFQDEPENTAPYGPEQYCVKCGFVPHVTVMSAPVAVLADLSRCVTLSEDPLVRKLEKTMLVAALARNDLDEAEAIASRLSPNGSGGGPGGNSLEPQTC